MSEKAGYRAVITADMVNSTHFSNEDTGKWLKELTTVLSKRNHFQWLLAPEIYRGDSFQGVLKDPRDALQVAVLSRAIMKSFAVQSDLRVAIGIGKTDLITDRAGTSDGEAFRLSGHLADQIRQQKARIGIALPYDSEPLNAVLGLLEILIENWTVAQSEVVAALIQKQTIKQIAESFLISQPAVSQRVAAANWWALENFLSSFPEYLTHYTNLKNNA